LGDWRFENQGEYTYEIVPYGKNMPVCVYVKTEREEILEHWHDEIEVVYTIAGRSIHYIDGQVYVAEKGSLLVTNSGSIHRIQTEPCIDDKYAIVLMIKYEFVERLVEQMNQKYFLTEVHSDADKIHEIMMGFLEFKEKHQEESYAELKATGLLYELLFYLCRDALVEKESVLPINSQKNLERLRGIMLYVRENYKEEMCQQKVAHKFYFSKEYFARFFKKNTGMTFIEYVTKYRVYEAAKEIKETDRSILDIALDCGFSDSRGLIRAFHCVYHTTPLQYRKESRVGKYTK
jgi:AraC-like DNA-binding protein/quercetin dioxygenase-like cupin family protein